MPLNTEDNAKKRNNQSTFLGHPAGLGYIVFTEAWERFSFYGMQALLVLYMAGYLFQPEFVGQIWGFSAFRAGIESVFGDLSTQALASQVFGLYIGLVYFLPIFGGMLGDRYIGRTTAVMTGAVLMMVGHFMMAYEPLFLFALSFLILGSGFLKGNLASQVGECYAPNDQRRDSAYTYYTIAINIGAFMAPLVCGSLGELAGWHWGFSAAGAGMLVSIVIYWKGRHHLPKQVKKQKVKRAASSMDADDYKVTAAIIVLLLISALFWIAQTQVWNTYPLWVKANVDRDLLSFLVPVTWFQSLDTLAVLMLAAPIILLWKRQSQTNTEPGDISKMIWGAGFFTVACLLLAYGASLNQGNGISILWPVLFHFMCAIGYLYLTPAILSLVSKSAPPSINAMLVSCYYVAIFLGSIASGWLGRFHETLSAEQFWLLHGALVASCGVLLLLLKVPFTQLFTTAMSARASNITQEAKP